MKKRGFTLIELLIVVAIIAILAAIAVPNFLEAQVRSKVSRVLNDMRSTAVAIESYAVDYNRYFDDQEWPGVFHFLTSPVAYMTSVPVDPFTIETARDWGFIWGGRDVLPFWYICKKGTRYGEAVVNSSRQLENGLWQEGRQRGEYGLISPGPDAIWEWDRAGNVPRGGNYSGDAVYYDATNGTKSQGDILYYGPGLGFNPPRQR
jgi:prepilin-type N-terminal cleavage/methylation domain-containing protein